MIFCINNNLFISIYIKLHIFHKVFFAVQRCKKTFSNPRWWQGTSTTIVMAEKRATTPAALAKISSPAASLSAATHPRPKCPGVFFFRFTRQDNQPNSRSNYIYYIFKVGKCQLYTWSYRGNLSCFCSFRQYFKCFYKSVNISPLLACEVGATFNLGMKNHATVMATL